MQVLYSVAGGFYSVITSQKTTRYITELILYTE